MASTLCAGCGRLRSDISPGSWECRECRGSAGRERAFAEFLLRFAARTPAIPTQLYPEYREWVAWAKGVAEPTP